MLGAPPGIAAAAQGLCDACDDPGGRDAGYGGSGGGEGRRRVAGACSDPGGRCNEGQRKIGEWRGGGNDTCPCLAQRV